MVRRFRSNSFWPLMIVGGVLAASHVWKVAGSLPAIVAEFHFSLFLAGCLFALIQGASIVGGVPTAWLGDLVGAKTLACAGLVALAGASSAGAAATSQVEVLVWRGLEGIGFVVYAVIAPALIATRTATPRREFALGAWAAFQGLGAFVGLALTPAVIAAISWRVWWLVLAGATVIIAILQMIAVPADRDFASPRTEGTSAGRKQDVAVGASLKSGATWIAGAAFACYSGPWLAVLGFLPTIMQAVPELGVGGVGLLAGAVGAANAVGAVVGARVRIPAAGPLHVLVWGFAGAAVSVACAFAIEIDEVADALWAVGWLVVFSAHGGVIAAVLTRMVVGITPSGSTPQVTFGLMQQIFNIGNLAIPPVLALLVGAVGGWGACVWLVIGAGCVGIVCAFALRRYHPGHAAAS